MASTAPEAAVAEITDISPRRLRYVGDGMHYVIGLPMADCEVPAFRVDALIETGLYELADGEASASAAGDVTPEGPSESEAPTAPEPTVAPTGE